MLAGHPRLLNRFRDQETGQITQIDIQQSRAVIHKQEPFHSQPSASIGGFTILPRVLAHCSMRLLDNLTGEY
jgi:hypothetical protein